MNKNVHKPKKEDEKQISITIAVISIIGLVAVAILNPPENIVLALVLYSIFGGGILGTRALISIIKAVLRVNNGK